MRKRYLIVVLLIFVIIAAKFWLGVYTHDEFGYKTTFIKHRPIWKTYFYSPRGTSDLKISDMTPERQKEQLLFDEFIIDNQFTNTPE